MRRAFPKGRRKEELATAVAEARAMHEPPENNP